MVADYNELVIEVLESFVDFPFPSLVGQCSSGSKRQDSLLIHDLNPQQAPSQEIFDELEPNICAVVIQAELCHFLGVLFLR